MANSILSAAHFHNEDAAFAYVEAHLVAGRPELPPLRQLRRQADWTPDRQIQPSRPAQVLRLPKTFTVRIGSIFEDSHFPLHLWLQAIQIIAGSKKGVSTRQIQRTFECSMKTAWFLMHRIREIMKPGDNEPPLGGEGKIIEADVTYVGRQPFRKAHRGGGSNKSPVFSLIERDGRARSTHMPNVRAHDLGRVLEEPSFAEKQPDDR